MGLGGSWIQFQGPLDFSFGTRPIPIIGGADGSRCFVCLRQCVVQFESALEKELMYTVASLSTRGDNLLDLVADEGREKITAKRFNVIKELTF